VPELVSIVEGHTAEHAERHDKEDQRYGAREGEPHPGGGDELEKADHQQHQTQARREAGDGPPGVPPPDRYWPTTVTTTKLRPTIIPATRNERLLLLASALEWRMGDSK
jgi:hypothetical protein